MITNHTKVYQPNGFGFSAPTIGAASSRQGNTISYEDVLQTLGGSISSDYPLSKQRNLYQFDGQPGIYSSQGQ